eukprot:1154324-Pelagomonas_calceolata.AAC.1
MFQLTSTRSGAGYCRGYTVLWLKMPSFPKLMWNKDRSHKTMRPKRKARGEVPMSVIEGAWSIPEKL